MATRDRLVTLDRQMATRDRLVLGCSGLATHYTVSFETPIFQLQTFNKMNTPRAFREGGG